MVKKTPTIILSVFLFVITVCLNNALKLNNKPNLSKDIDYQVPSSIQKSLSLGYDHTFSLLQWFYLISQFDDAYKKRYGDLAYVHLAEKLDLITNLNTRATHAYYMAATILPWATHSTSLSRPLLEKAMRHMPKQWKWPYYEGFNAYWFDHDMKHAALLMSKAASLPDSPPIIVKLAARMQAESGSLDTALEFLQNLLQQKQDANLKKELTKHIQLIITEKQLQQVEQWLKTLPKYQFNLKGIQYLKKHGYAIPAQLADGGHIIFLDDGTIVSSKTKKRFKVFIPPKHQGVINHESTH